MYLWGKILYNRCLKHLLTCCNSISLRFLLCSTLLNIDKWFSFSMVVSSRACSICATEKKCELKKKKKFKIGYLLDSLMA